MTGTTKDRNVYELVIANKNYSSWSMRPWVLMRALQIPFAERLLLFHANAGDGGFPQFFTLRPRALPGGWGAAGVGFVCDCRISGGEARGRLAAGPGSARLGAIGCSGDAFGIPGAARHMFHEYRSAGAFAPGITAAARGSVPASSRSGNRAWRHTEAPGWEVQPSLPLTPSSHRSPRGCRPMACYWRRTLQPMRSGCWNLRR